MKPILFNTDMVRAILDGRKTQTRRLVKGIPLQSPYFEVVDGVPMVCDENGDWHPATDYSRIQPGDVLWVRETWCALPVSPGGHIRIPDRYYYRADPELRPEAWRGKWRPSIHMPKEAARLFLRVTDVRVERLRDGLGCLQALQAEGVKSTTFPSILFEFRELWNGTIKPADHPRYGWGANPWVWVYEFERCDKP